MNFLKITSAQNDSVKQVIKLRNRRERDETKLTILEGYRELFRAHEYGMNIVECFFAPDLFLGDNELDLLKRLANTGARVIEVPDHLLKRMTYRDRPEGLVAIANMQSHLLEHFPLVKNGLYLVAESVEKPGNLGSILRSADAAGANGLLICDKCTDLYNPNVIRASTGALFSVPLAETSSENAIKFLRDNNINILATTPHTDKIYTEVDLTTPTAIVVGTEQYGLSDIWLEEADILVKIPMLGKIDSLNVATATTILLYEAARQRKWRISN